MSKSQSIKDEGVGVGVGVGGSLAEKDEPKSPEQRRG